MINDLFWLVETVMWISGVFWPAYGLVRKYLVHVHEEQLRRYSR